MKEEINHITKSDFQNTWVLFILICTLVYLLQKLGVLRIVTQRFQRQALVDVYGVDKKTFNKWIHLLYPEIQPFLAGKRHLDVFTFLLTFYLLGLPGFPTEEVDVHTKGEIVRKGEGSYRSLRESVNQSPKPWPISPKAFSKLSIFPPKVSALMLEVYG